MNQWLVKCIGGFEVSGDPVVYIDPDKFFREVAVIRDGDTDTVTTTLLNRFVSCGAVCFSRSECLVYSPVLTSQPSWRLQVAVATLVALNQVCLDDQNKNYSSFKSTQMNESLHNLMLTSFEGEKSLPVHLWRSHQTKTQSVSYFPSDLWSHTNFTIPTFAILQNATIHHAFL